MKILRSLGLASLLIGSANTAWATEIRTDEEQVVRRPMGCKLHAPDELEEFRKLHASRPHSVAPQNFKVPDRYDLTPFSYNPRFDQGDLGSCTGNGGANAAYIVQVVQTKKSHPELSLEDIKKKAEPASRLWIYYYEQVLEGSLKEEDPGAYIKTCMRVFDQYGAPVESLWTYDENTKAINGKLPKYKTEPSTEAKNNVTIKDLDGLAHDVILPKRNKNDLNSMFMSLASGQPLVIGAVVFDEFMSKKAADTGVVDMPDRRSQNQGGHCTVLVGYDKKDKVFYGLNSWGPGWGVKDASGHRGIYSLPFKFVENPSWVSEIWRIGKITALIVNPKPLALKDHTIPVYQNDNNRLTIEDTKDKPDAQNVK